LLIELNPCCEDKQTLEFIESTLPGLDALDGKRINVKKVAEKKPTSVEKSPISATHGLQQVPSKVSVGEASEFPSQAYASPGSGSSDLQLIIDEYNEKLSQIRVCRPKVCWLFSVGAGKQTEHILKGDLQAC
jgi:hypothetical protein